MIFLITKTEYEKATFLSSEPKLIVYFVWHVLKNKMALVLISTKL